MVGKTLLVVGAGRESLPALAHAKALGYQLVLSDGDQHAPGLQYADGRFLIPISTYDVGMTIDAAQWYHRTMCPINGVLSFAADVPLTVASVAQALGLPGISLETARLCSDKLLQKAHLQEHGIPVPWYAAAQSAVDLVAALELFPCIVVKPVDSRGARGVLRLTRQDDLVWAYEHAKSQSPTGRVMVEEYLAGPQISTETVLHDGWAMTPGFIDRNYEYLDRFAPYMIENGGSQPSMLPLDEQHAVCDVAEQAARALGIVSGTCKGDMVLTKSGPVVIEMAARLSGGYMSSIQIPLATGVDLVGAAIKLACGEPLTQEEVTPKYHKGVAIRYYFPRPGRVCRIGGPDEGLLSRHDVAVVSVNEGDVLSPVTDHTKRAGFVITTDATHEAAVARAEAVVCSMRIETEAAWTSSPA